MECVKKILVMVILKTMLSYAIFLAFYSGFVLDLQVSIIIISKNLTKNQ